MIDPVMMSGVLKAGSSVMRTQGSANPAGMSVGKADFSDVLGQVSRTMIGDLNKAEALSVKALQGDADTRAVIDAVMSAERSLQTAIAIRDKIVTAYLEVSRMAI